MPGSLKGIKCLLYLCITTFGDGFKRSLYTILGITILFSPFFLDKIAWIPLKYNVNKTSSKKNFTATEMLSKFRSRITVVVGTWKP